MKMSSVVNRSYRFRYFWSNSKPFLSGDLFADESDIALYGPRFRNIPRIFRRLSEAKVVFCPGEMVDSLFEDLGNRISPKVIVVGNSDRDFNHFDFRLPKSVKHVFLQNQLFIDARFTPLPIGLENIRIGINGLPRNFLLDSAPTKNSILVGPFSPTHEERYSLLDRINVGETPDFVVVQKSQLPPTKYSDLASQYQFVACPRGNGHDTHRFWETLYRGSIPVVRRSIWSYQFTQMGLPIRELDDWEELLINKDLRKIDIFFRPKDLEIIWWPYWRNLIARYL